MMIQARALTLSVCAVIASGGVALAQQAGGYSAGPGLLSEAKPRNDTTAPQPPVVQAPTPTPANEYETIVRPSPEWSQDRMFPGTRFWKLDPGRYELEAWWRVRKPRSGDGYHLMQLELELGLTPRIQLDLYENLTTEGGKLRHEGNQIEARIAIDPVYGRTPLNPVVYLEWHPRHHDADRAEVRLLGGGEILGPSLVGAVNLFFEHNVTRTATGFVANPEMGFTAAASYALLGQSLRAGGEVKLAFEKEEWSDSRWEKQLLAGPNVSARIASQSFKVYATVLFGITDDAKSVDSFLILAYDF
jgi:hypothetical protein